MKKPIDDVGYKKWTTQLQKGFLELCILMFLRSNDTVYGTGLLQAFNRLGIATNEGTLYPLLNRMHRNALLTSDWQLPQTTGHPRRMYRISQAGIDLCDALLQAYEDNHTSLLKLKGKS